MSKDLKALIDSVGENSSAFVGWPLAQRTSVINELKQKLSIGETALKFYRELPTPKRMLVDSVLPAELKALIVGYLRDNPLAKEG